MPNVRGWKRSQNRLEYHLRHVAHRPAIHMLSPKMFEFPALVPLVSALVAPIPLPHPTQHYFGSGELCGAALSISFVNVENGKWKMAAPSILSRSCVQTVAGLPSLGASLVKARVGNPFFARLELQGTHYGISQQLRRTLVVSPKQDANTPLVSPNPPTPTCSYMEST